MNRRGEQLLQEFGRGPRGEAPALKAYLDPRTALWRVGWGATHLEDGSPVLPGTRVSPGQADLLLRQDIAVAEGAVFSRTAGTPLHEPQLSALACLTVDVGVEAFANSLLLHLVRQVMPRPARREELKREWLGWDPGYLHELEGAQRLAVEKRVQERRAAEWTLYTAPVPGWSAPQLEHACPHGVALMDCADCSRAVLS